MSSKIETTPEVNISFSASTSRGDAGDQAADGILVVEPDVHALQVAEDLAAQIEHHLLPRPLHEISLQNSSRKLKSSRPTTMAAICAMPIRGWLLRKRSSSVCAPRYRRQVSINGDLGQVRPQHVGARL